MARTLGGEVAGDQVLCPGPGHSRKDRSIAVRLSPGSPDGVLVWSHGRTSWQDAKDHVLALLGVTPDRGGRQERLPSPATRRAEPLPAPPSDDDLDRRRRAERLWSAAGDPRGTLVAAYLASRGLPLPDEVAGAAIRFHAVCPFGDERLPVMVAALRCIRTDRIHAVHRTALTAVGAKVGRKMLGPAAGCAVKLDADAEVGRGLAIGEGIETCLAARMLGFRPTWALGSVGAIRVFPVLPGIESLTILCETGDGGASEEAARECGARWHAAGREVILARPRIGGDMNDAIREART
ncbi:toprim domain-containing protein [Methylobacterium sp. J-043]|nr:toprim domain-containing protein [Methylobacterium sp. J-043]